MAKRQASLLSFCQSTHKRQRKSEEKADDDQDQESDVSNCQDVRLKIPQKIEHSYHDPSHIMSTLRPQIFGDLSAPELAGSLNNNLLSELLLVVFVRFQLD